MFEQYLAEELEIEFLPLLETIAMDNIMMSIRGNSTGGLLDSVEASFDASSGAVVLEVSYYGVLLDTGLNGNSPFTATEYSTERISFDYSIGESGSASRVIRERGGRIGISGASIARSLQLSITNPDVWAIRRSIINDGYSGVPWVEATIDDTRLDDAMAEAADRAMQRVLDEIEF